MIKDDKHFSRLCSEGLSMFNGECKLATIWLYSKDTEKAGAFYRDLLQMKQIEHGETNSFDGGGLRLSIHPMPKGWKRVPNGSVF